MLFLAFSLHSLVVPVPWNHELLIAHMPLQCQARLAQWLPCSSRHTFKSCLKYLLLRITAPAKSCKLSGVQVQMTCLDKALLQNVELGYNL